MVSTQHLSQSAQIVQDVLCAQGRQPLAVKLKGLATLVESMIENRISPLDSVFCDVDCLKVVQNKAALRKAGSGSVYNVMGFMVKVYQYGMGSDRRRIVAAPESGAESLSDSIMYNGHYYDSIALTVTEDSTEFNALQCLGAVTVLDHFDDSIPVSGFAYSTRVSPTTLRFMVATTKVSAPKKAEMASIEELIAPESAFAMDAADDERTSLFATV